MQNHIYDSVTIVVQKIQDRQITRVFRSSFGNDSQNPVNEHKDIFNW